jgi:hypothetical protein
VIVHQQDPLAAAFCLSLFGLGHGCCIQIMASAATADITSIPDAANRPLARAPLISHHQRTAHNLVRSAAG